MYLLKTKQTIYIIGFLLLGFFTQAQNNESANNIYLQWQTSNCGIDGDKALIKLLLKNASDLEPKLFKGFREGPPTKYIKNTTESELNRIRINQKLISDQEFKTGLSKEELKIAAEINLDSARANIKKRIINGWKTRALTGISYLNTDKSIKLLETLVEDKSSSFSALAKFLLAQQNKD